MSTNDWDNSDQQSTGTGFGWGLLVGGFAGIATYYLFGTKQGEALWKKLVEEYEYAKVTIPQEISQILEEQGSQQASQQRPHLPTEASMTSVKQGLLASLWGTKETQAVVDQPAASKKKQRNLFHRSTKR